MSHIRKLLAAILCATCAMNVHAGFKEAFLKKFPAAEGAKIEKAFPGFHSVVKGSEIYFVRDDMSILIAGNVVDLKTNRSLTSVLQAQVEDAKPKLDVAQLDLNDAIKIGNGARRLFVFSDPDCPYCRSLESSLSQLSDVTVYIFPFPLAQLHPNAPGVSEAIWCQADRAKAWRDYQEIAKLVAPDQLMASWRQYLRTRGQPDQPVCANPIARNLALGQKWRIAGTPAIIFEDGALIPGAVPAERIEAQLKKSHTALLGASK